MNTNQPCVATDNGARRRNLLLPRRCHHSTFAQKMKPLAAIGGIGLITAPVLYFLTFEQRATEVATKDDVVGLVGSISVGLMIGFFGLMILGFLCDCGQGFKPLWLLSVMLLLGFAWSLIYPSGWMLGIPLVLYSGGQIIRAARTKTVGANKSLDTKS